MRDAQRPQKEPLCEQLSSFVGFFVYLLVLKSFFLPLFIIPTGSMAETLYGEHATHTCPNCGVDYPVGFVGQPPRQPPVIQCPNCRWREATGPAGEATALKNAGLGVDAPIRIPLHEQAGDRIMVHGWPYVLWGGFQPQRWDVVVFKVPTDGQTNYIKRLIGKPGETIEVIDGDIFVTDPQAGQTGVAHKTPAAQESLWFRYYDHDHAPRQASVGGQFHPRWVALEDDSGWSGLETRRPRFVGAGGQAGEIRFVTAPPPAHEPGLITDVFGYNCPLVPTLEGGRQRLGPAREYVVTDTRLSCAVRFETVAGNGFVELSSTKHEDVFFARLYGDGRVTLEHASESNPQRQPWGDYRVPNWTGGPVRLALGNVDYVVSVEVDGWQVIRTKPEQYDITPAQARERSKLRRTPRLSITAQDANLSLEHLLIERDEYYTYVSLDDLQQPGFGVQGNPIKLGPDDYFVLGDNSPASLDSRFSFAQQAEYRVGPHLRAAFKKDQYHLGTVPADQLIGPAFLVYWPGTQALVSDQHLPPVPLFRFLNQLPDPGHIRWIR